MRHVVIVAGGSGTRLWPLSRKGMPKQLLHLVEDKSLLRIAYERVAPVVGADHVWVCTGRSYRDVVEAELPEIDPSHILGEPVGRDSLNAMAWPTAVLDRLDPEATVAVVTADQIMRPDDTFRERLDVAFEVVDAEPEALVTFGVVPTTPHTGYGYLHRGEPVPGFAEVTTVREFREKPDRATAERYLASGEYWWNSGMFVWRAATFLAQLRVLAPESYNIVAAIAEDPGRVDELFLQAPKISVDYAIMEPVSRAGGPSRVLVVSLPIQWYDIGGFPALADQLPHDAEGNAGEGPVVHLDSRDTLVINRTGDGHLVATVGLSDMVVVRTADVTLVCPKGDTERIKSLVAAVREEAGESFV
ncbi:mannose-1-phosphate guanylyltransferase (GDP) [Raineyella antarctica]|uniref:Mannose-1-phosphate guanylyltransferase (GDP) n=1 Tax=Raineyella antarctica TaxID=1577474 RepID=A0A1G6H4J3_9ACTN|nr:sugar phosphate nucleotidyltransferase [Raineyella antarctica]SDB89064.1 mannose-1-phosphate guanylyltransferase (GDP) [Raineyella antarctica]